VDNENGTLSIGAYESDGSDCRPASVNGDADNEPWALVTRANAAFIVLAVNCHNELVEALRPFAAIDTGRAIAGQLRPDQWIDSVTTARIVLARAEATP
jgi:hypothetical protein